MIRRAARLRLMDIAFISIVISCATASRSPATDASVRDPSTGETCLPYTSAYVCRVRGEHASREIHVCAVSPNSARPARSSTSVPYLAAWSVSVLNAFASAAVAKDFSRLRPSTQ